MTADIATPKRVTPDIVADPTPLLRESAEARGKSTDAKNANAQNAPATNPRENAKTASDNARERHDRRRETLVSLDGEPDVPFFFDDVATSKKVEINNRRNKAQDKTVVMDEAARAFRYEDAKNEYWNPESFSLLYGSPLWDQSSTSQRVVLNQLYWVAYYSQIISAEIATIFFNQTAAAALYSIEEFRPVTDMLDLESAQERAHINAFRRVGDDVESALFGERVFTYPMRTPYAETMIFQDAGTFRRFWKWVQLNAFTLLSSNNAFIGCQYFLVRGVRTLCGKIVQHQLSQYHQKYDRPVDEGGQNRPKDDAPIPSKISYFHFCDESYHFNSSTIVSHDVVKSLAKPTAFERAVVNAGLMGSQRDHEQPSSMVNGIFWDDPAGFSAVYKVLTSDVFALDDKGARDMLWKCFCEDNDMHHAAQATHATARESYIRYLAPLDFVSTSNREMSLMGQASVPRTLARNRDAFHRALKNATPAKKRNANDEPSRPRN